MSERGGRSVRPVETMPHADELEFGPGMVRLRREEEPGVFQRLAQAGGGDDFEIKIEPGRSATPVVGIHGGMELGDNARAERAELDRRAVVPMAAAAGAPLRKPGEQAAVVVEERAGDAVLVGEQQGQEIAEPAQQHLVLRVEEFRAVGRLVAEAAHLEEIARALAELRRIDAQVDLHACLERVVARFDFPDDAQLTPRVGGSFLRAGGEPVDQLLAEESASSARSCCSKSGRWR